MMRIHIAAANVDCSYHVLGIKGSPCSSYPSIKERRGEGCPSPLKSRKLFKSLALLDRCDSRGGHTRRTVCRASLDEGFAQNHVSGDVDSDCGSLVTRVGRVTTEAKSPPNRDGYGLVPKCSFRKSQPDLLEPKLVGIGQDWPEKESLVWAHVEQKARTFGVPLSLKMIQKRNRIEGGLKEMGELELSSMAKAFSSMVSTIVELQSCAMQMRQVVCDEDIGPIISGVQSDMRSSFAWLFQQVYSRTPDLMVHVMTLLADFSVHSTSQYLATSQISLKGSFVETTEEMAPFRSLSGVDLGFSQYGNPNDILQLGDQALRNEAEVSLWSSFVDEAKSLSQEGSEEPGLDQDVLWNMVAPISVEIESDNYMEFLRTDLMYQMRLSQEPDNQLLLSNYAQFLQLVPRDYDRAEECFKRAIRIEPPDAESISQYAEFLWMVRKDLWRAEEAYLQAISFEPENSYYASKYAHFLWNTGGDETCYPLDDCDTDSKSLDV